MTLLRQVIRESLRASNIKAMSGNGQTYSIISAYVAKSKSANKQRHAMFLRDIRERGYKRFWETKAPPWNQVAEKALVIPGMIFEEAVHLGKKYGQDAIIFKGSDGIVAMYDLNRNVAMVMSETLPNISGGRNLYSRTQGVSFEFNIDNGIEVPWNGRYQIHIEDLEGKIAA